MSSYLAVISIFYEFTDLVFRIINRFIVFLFHRWVKLSPCFVKRYVLLLEHVCEYKENFTAGGRAKFILVSNYGGTNLGHKGLIGDTPRARRIYHVPPRGDAFPSVNPLRAPRIGGGQVLHNDGAN